MANKKYGLAFLILLVGLSSACAPIYRPVSPNTPMLSGQGETKAEINLASSGVELKSAHAFTDRIALGVIVSAGSEFNDNDHTSEHRYLEPSVIGFFRPADILVVETSGGLGVGSGKGEGYRLLTDHTFTAEGAYFKPFIQNNLALQTKVLDLGIVNRLSVIQFSEIRSTQGDGEIITNPSTPVFWEPSVFLQVGWDRFRLNTQIGVSNAIAGEPDFDWQGVFAGVGMGFHFGR